MVFIKLTTLFSNEKGFAGIIGKKILSEKNVLCITFVIKSLHDYMWIIH